MSCIGGTCVPRWRRSAQAEATTRRLREALEAARKHIAVDASMQQCDGTDSCWYCFCAETLDVIDAALARTLED